MNSRFLPQLPLHIIKMTTTISREQEKMFEYDIFGSDSEYFDFAFAGGSVKDVEKYAH